MFSTCINLIEVYSLELSLRHAADFRGQKKRKIL